MHEQQQKNIIEIKPEIDKIYSEKEMSEQIRNLSQMYLAKIDLLEK